MRILIVEDEKLLNRVIAKKLKSEKYNYNCCFDGEEAYAFASNEEYDVILLDLMLPKMNGIEVLKKLRAQGNTTPVLILTAKGSVEDRILGLDSGADDYLVKPFDLDELMARIRVLSRRKGGSASNIIEIADLKIDIEKRQVSRSGKAIELTAKEFDILQYMARNKGIVLSREKIEAHAWDYDFEGASNVIDVYIRFLRKKIDEGYDKKLVHTKRGSGYVLKEDDQ